MKKKVLIKGALIVFIASTITRVLGFFFRVFLADNLKAHGMGIYQLILSLYMLVVTFSTTGINFAVSRLVSEEAAIKNNTNSKKILKISILWGLFVATIVCLTLITFKNQFANFVLREKKATLSILFLAPSLPFMAISSCIKGYFFAKRKPIFPSIASILEQIIKMGLIMFLIKKFIEQGIEKSCAIISIGMTASEIASCIFMSILYMKYKDENIVSKTKMKNGKNLLVKILKVSVPIQTSTSFNAVLKLIEGILIIQCLKIYTNGDSQAATGAYGIVRGMVLPLIMFPTSFLQSIITVLIPELSGATAGKNKKAIKKACEKSLQLTLIMGIFIAAIFIMFPNEISSIFYKNSNVAPILKTLSLLCPVLYLQLICMGILNAIGEQMACMKYNLLEGILRIILIPLTVPKGGINSFLALMFISNILVVFLYVLRLVKVTSFPICINKILFKPLIAISISCAFAILLKMNIKFNLSNLNLILIFSVIIFLTYFILLLFLNCLKIPQKNLLKTKTNKL